MKTTLQLPNHFPRSTLSAFVLYLNQYVHLSKDAKAYLTAHTQTMTISHDKTILKVGQPATTLYFVHNGGLRYHVDWGKHMITPALFLPGSLAPHPMDVYFQFPALYELRTLRHTLLSVIDQEHLYAVVSYYPELRKALPSILLETRHIHAERSIWEKWAPQQKLTYFVEQYPKHYLTLHRKVLASYLGISPEHLSRLLAQKT